MRLAVLADIHGNLPAFEAVLADTEKRQVDSIVIAGDLVNGAPDAAACWRRARSLGCPLLRGNHERYLFDLHAPHTPPIWHTQRFGPVHWSYAQCDAAVRQEMKERPIILRPPGSSDLAVVHASARADNDLITPHTPTAALAPMFAGCDESLLVRGHNHIPGEKKWGHRTILTTGSVGIPLNGDPSAQYLLLEHRRDGWDWQHQAVPYDLREVENRFRTSGYLEKAGPIASLYLREILSASFYMAPFLRQYRQWCNDGEIALDLAVRRFMELV
jgi:predicted phosphodiesterase